MSDFINIRVTEAELDLITCLLEQAGTMEDSNGQPAFELLHDLMEQAARPGDWTTEDLDPTDLDGDLTGRTFEIAEDHFIDAGIQAREQAKASSRAAERRALNFSARDERPRSETQQVDVWDANDPRNW